ncbi:MAG: molybdenum cofactor biosynthesis protein MoaB [Thermoplasmata archaeon]|nr:MAG: molybdenum cofactor biosynthesis protein MoaB [Thermoplasmata archaeon]
MGFEEHKKHAHGPVACAVITVSSTRSEENDESGKAIISLLNGKGHQISQYSVIKDDVSAITSEIEKALGNQNTQAIIINGGTGISSQDVTVEAVKPFLERELVGFGELFRYLSYKDIGSPAMLSRALAGVCQERIIICLPGSTSACVRAMESLILPELGHMLYELKK